MMSERLNQLRVPLIFALILALLVGAYFLFFIREYKEVDQGWSKEARKNPYFAAQKFLADKSHITWRSHQALLRFEQGQFNWQGQQLGPTDTLIVEDSYGSLSPQEADNLLEWVEGGGHLIYHTNNPHIDIQRVPTDPIVEYLGLAVAERPEPTRNTPVTIDSLELPSPPKPSQLLPQAEKSQPPVRYFQRAASLQTPPAHCYLNDRSASITLPELENPLQVYFKNGQGLYQEDEIGDVIWQFDDGFGIIGLALQVKSGRITLMNNLSLWDNNYLVCGDNGFFLQQLLGPGKNIVWFLNLDAPNLWQRLWAFAPEVLVALLLALATWLWHNNVRFGEALADSSKQRRAFLDHFKAWTNFLWRPQLISAQIQAQRQFCLSRAARRLPGFLQLAPAQQLEHLERVTGLHTQVLQRALFANVDARQVQTTAIIQALQQLRSHL
jgi:hypothetical protein